MDLDAIPVRAEIEFEEDGDYVILMMPRYPTALGRFVGKVLRRSSHIRVKHDRQGSVAWRLIDGSRSVRRIGEEMKAMLGEEVEPVYPRLVEFLAILAGNRFVEFRKDCEVANVEQ